MIELVLWQKNWKILILYSSEISIKWHKKIPPFILNIGHKGISVAWKMKVLQDYALLPLFDLPGLYNLCDSLGPSDILLYYYLFTSLCLSSNLNAKTESFKFSNILSEDNENYTIGIIPEIF